MFKDYFLTEKIRGMSLLEVMFALSLGILILGLLMSAFQASQRSLRLQHALYQIQDHGNFAISLLTNDIKQAGQSGCGRITGKTPLIGTANEISIHYVRAGAALISDMENTHEVIASSEPRIAAGSNVMIVDCIRSETAQVLRVYHEKNRQRIILRNALPYKFRRYAEIGMLVTHHYFIARTQRHYTDGSRIYALFDNENGRTHEMVEGINHMQFVYTLKQDHSVEDKPADSITDWSQVIGIAIELVLFTPPFKRNAYAYAIINAGVV